MSTGFKQRLVQTWTTVLMLYTTGQRNGWRHILLHTFTCLFISLAISSLLFITLQAVRIELWLSCLIAAGFSLLMTVALCFSKNLRCFILLLLISCSMQQGRAVLLTTGAGLVMCLSVRNTFRNLCAVSQSIVCNLKKKKDLLDNTPIMDYIRMIQRVKKLLKMVSDFGLVKFEANLDVSYWIESGVLRAKLQQAEKELQDKTDRAQAVFDLVIFVIKMVCPVLGIIFLVVLAALFLRKYLRNKRYKNTYITSKFVEYDEQQKAKGKPHVLPLTKKEASNYLSIPSVKIRLKECLPVALFFIPVGSYIFCWLLLIGLDWLLYWIILVINKQLMSVKPFYIPLRVNVYKSEKILFLDVGEESNSADFSYSVNVFERDCVPEPTLLLSQSVVPLSVIISVLLILGLLTSKLEQVKLLASEQFFTETTEKRVKHLHAKILRKRSKEKFPALVLMKNVKFWFPILDFCGRSEDLPLHSRTQTDEH
ncbi:dendritic cell-specific transmembrane protein-like [Astyanax mexicanus]|uniref:Dendrocyte expressed seven transmembrane protein n=1 Tax=Astyanax mexicanus TaxID=7994 RepID=A0A3B1IWA5_ASTMX|nr:dendritic cell-specific transmembrane protein-like [Astyanax mexicanus]